MTTKRVVVPHGTGDHARFHLEEDVRLPVREDDDKVEVDTPDEECGE